MRSSTFIVAILYKYYQRKELSHGEIHYLQEWLVASEQNQQLFDELSDTAGWERQLNAIKSQDPAPTWVLIKGRIEQDKSALIMPFRWWRVAAAVGGLILIAGIWATYYFRLPTQELPLVINQNVPVNDILPGNNTVRLTLGNGSVVVLDSLGNQPIVEEGKAIAEQTLGMIRYSQSGTTTVNNSINILTTPVGNMVTVILADGSKVWLNALSTLKYPVQFNGDSRNVTLTGEAYFEIAHLSSPFIVHTKRGDIAVLGTHFNANDYADESMMETTLMEGKVLVRSGNDSIVLRPGEGAGVSNQNAIQRFVADTSFVLAWKQKVFRFQKADYQEIFKQLARWYDLEVIFRHPVNARFSGILPKDRPLSQLLAILAKAGQVKFEIRGKQVMVN
jgi:transmembrane sensor